jgi:hypothetical protein
MRCTDLLAGSKIRKGQRHLRVMGHELQDPGIKAPQAVAQQTPQMGQTPVRIKAVRERNRHP